MTTTLLLGWVVAWIALLGFIVLTFFGHGWPPLAGIVVGLAVVWWWAARLERALEREKAEREALAFEALKRETARRWAEPVRTA